MTCKTKSGRRHKSMFIFLLHNLPCRVHGHHHQTEQHYYSSTEQNGFLHLYVFFWIKCALKGHFALTVVTLTCFHRSVSLRQCPRCPTSVFAADSRDWKQENIHVWDIFPVCVRWALSFWYYCEHSRQHTTSRKHSLILVDEILVTFFFFFLLINFFVTL